MPQELADAMYDPRMFFNKEMYFDPDIIGECIINKSVGDYIISVFQMFEDNRYIKEQLQDRPAIPRLELTRCWI